MASKTGEIWSKSGSASHSDVRRCNLRFSMWRSRRCRWVGSARGCEIRIRYLGKRRWHRCPPNVELREARSGQFGGRLPPTTSGFSRPSTAYRQSGADASDFHQSKFAAPGPGQYLSLVKFSVGAAPRSKTSDPSQSSPPSGRNMRHGSRCAMCGCTAPSGVAAARLCHGVLHARPQRGSQERSTLESLQSSVIGLALV